MLLVALFVVYLVLLTWTILWKLAVPWVGASAGLFHPIKLVPYVADANANASAPLEVVANILLFVPFGVYLVLLTPSWRWWQNAVVFVAASLALETAQHLLSTGSFDITDVIDNTAGGLVGLAVFALARRRLAARTRPVLGRVLLVASVVALLAVVIFVASPLRYAQQPDVVLPGVGVNAP